MRYGVIEIIGLFTIVAGVCAMVAAAALVSTALAVVVTGFFLCLAGVLAVFVAVQLERAKAGRAKPVGRPEQL